MIYFGTVAAGLAIVFAIREALHVRAQLICQKQSDRLLEELQPKFDVAHGAYLMPVSPHPNEII
jgi:hypothetical protein